MHCAIPSERVQVVKLCVCDLLVVRNFTDVYLEHNDMCSARIETNNYCLSVVTAHAQTHIHKHDMLVYPTHMNHTHAHTHTHTHLLFVSLST